MSKNLSIMQRRKKWKTEKGKKTAPVNKVGTPAQTVNTAAVKPAVSPVVNPASHVVPESAQKVVSIVVKDDEATETE